MANTGNPGSFGGGQQNKGEHSTGHQPTQLGQQNRPSQPSGTDLKQKAQQAGAAVSEKAHEAASSAAGAAQHLGQRASDMASQAGQQVGDTVSSLGGQMKSLAGTIREHAPEEGWTGSAASTVADSLEKGGRYLQQESLSEIADDITGVVRRYPLQSVLIGVGIGFLLAKATSSRSY